MVFSCSGLSKYTPLLSLTSHDTISWSSNFQNQSGYDDDDGMLFLGSIDDIRCCDSMGTST